MNRRRFVALIGGALAARLSRAQQPGKVYRIGYLSPTVASPTGPLPVLIERLREFGYTEGRNLVVERRNAAGNMGRLDEFAAELVRIKVDLIVALATPAAQAARKATASVPIVFIGVVDPVGAGLVANLARPDGNTTGLSILSAELSGKRVELLREVVPGLSRVAVLGNPDNASNRLQLAGAEAAARKFGIEVRFWEARTGEQIERVFQSTAGDRASALIVLDDSFLFMEQTRIAALAARHRLPAMHGFGESVEAGGLIAYGMNLPDHYRRAAVYVDKILKGAKPAELPVEQPTKFDLTINLKTARALGIKIPQSILLRADRVIE